VKNTKYPDEFISVFNENDLDEIEGNILWLKIKLPNYIETDILHKINCNINCFPIVNRRVDKVYVSCNEKVKGPASE